MSIVPMLKTHLSILQQQATLRPEAAAFKVPELPLKTPRRWRIVTYAQFWADVDKAAVHWLRTFGAELHPRAVIAVWVSGLTYSDTAHIYGVARAGLVPQLFSLKLPNPDMIYELMCKGGAQALIANPDSTVDFSACPVSYSLAVHIDSIPSYDTRELLPIYQPLNPNEVSMIFHTSGSTSGSPKLVHCSYRWLDAIISKQYHASIPIHSSRQDVHTWLGSMCHIGQTTMLFGIMQHGSCTIQPSVIAFKPDELVDMIHSGGLNRLNQFAAFLSNNLRVARQDPKLLQQLQGLDEVLYAGMPLPPDDEQWALGNGVPVRNLFGSTECAVMMLSVGGFESDSTYLVPIEGTRYAFFPIGPAPAQGANPNAQLKELVILSESPDCPAPALRHADGHYHTGDLFQEVAPGRFVCRGRDDDWIKTESALRCDTKAIEDNVRATCADLVAECVVVGSGRPCPTLFVESRADLAAAALKKQIMRRIRQFHTRRYAHEKIDSERYIVVVEAGALPRTVTKGNIRRGAVEETFREELDRVYDTSR